MKITFLGAAGEVTGSQHLIETDSRRLLLDCGLFQGHRAEARRKNEQFHCNPPDLDAVILSHAHMDHSGNLPGLYRAGFRGPIFCTHATADVTAIMLRDSAKIQSEDARYLARHLGPKHPPIEPLYDDDDVRKTIRLFEELSYAEWHELGTDVRVRFQDAGHILGSAIVELELEEDGVWKRVVFTGDLGRRGLPILRDPRPVDRCDVLITECTYGDRVHPAAADMKGELLKVFRRAIDRNGKVIVPAFSLGRTQTLLYFLNEAHNAGDLPDIPIFVDSPLSNRITEVYRRHSDIMDADVYRTTRTDKDPFDFPGLTFVSSREESMQLNRRKGPFAVIAASGMCEGGRVVHHLKHAVDDKESTIVMIGFQAANTLGRRLKDQANDVRIFDRKIPVRAEVVSIDGLSAHADVTDFKWWFSQLGERGGAGQTFLVHGEQNSARGLASIVAEYSDEPPVIPQFGESFEV